MSSPAKAKLPNAEAVPSRFGAFLFGVKAWLLRIQRTLLNLVSPVRRYKADDADTFPVQIAESRTPLWTTESLVERSLQLGKVQNLRTAARAIQGIVIPAGHTFSFWRQLGRATRKKGYVSGRELREGCLIPAVGGGLCQLSNALYDAALQSGCEIVERHAHSRVVPGSAAEIGRDATVAWNYIDLRFRPKAAIRIQVHLTAQDLSVRFLAEQTVTSNTSQAVARPTLPQVLNPIAHTCTDCGVSECFRHIDPQTTAQSKSAYLLDECWPEFLLHVEEHLSPGDFVAAPALFGRYGSVGRLRAKARLHSTSMPAMWRAIRMRAASTVPLRVEAQLKGSQQVAKAMAKDLPFEATHIVIAQSLLPSLWQSGALGGRTFDVFMTRMPLSRLHSLLDDAGTRHPELKTLREYRAPQEMVEGEQEALASAGRLITPHSAIAGLFGERAVHLPWSLPKVARVQRGSMVVFPGPTVARKGALTLRSALVAMDCDLMILARNLEQSDFWQGVKVVSATENWLEHAAVVVQPALLEDNPRPLLRAVAAGIPVICTSNCGLGNVAGVTTVEFGNVEQLRIALAAALVGNGACDCRHSS